MTFQTDTLDGESQQISFDARQGRAKLLLYWLLQITNAQALNNYTMWLKSLKNLNYICAPYVKPTDAQEVKELLIKAERNLAWYQTKKGVAENLVSNSLDKLTEKTLFVFKDQFMQTSTKESGEFDPSQFDGGE